MAKRGTKYRPPKPKQYEPGYVAPFSCAFEAWINKHEPVAVDVVLEQLRRIPVGHHGVAGARGSGWDDNLWSSQGGGRAVGPGTVVKRLEEDLFLVGCTRPYLSAAAAAEKITELMGGKR